MSSARPSDLIVFYCDVCRSDVESLRPSIDVVGHEVCEGCFKRGMKPLFERALRNEQQYPPKWGNKTLEITPFASRGLLSTQFVQDYLDKEEEWAVLPRQQVYYASGQCKRVFLGTATQSTHIKQCATCGIQTCCKCRVPLPLRADDVVLQDHKCEQFYDTLATEDDLPDTRGQEWQKCPGENCGVLTTLADGCNHVICTIPACRAEFCFVCGEPAKEDSNHWGRGRPCPRYRRQVVDEGEEDDEQGNQYDSDSDDSWVDYDHEDLSDEQILGHGQEVIERNEARMEQIEWRRNHPGEEEEAEAYVVTEEEPAFEDGVVVSDAEESQDALIDESTEEMGILHLDIGEEQDVSQRQLDDLQDLQSATNNVSPPSMEPYSHERLISALDQFRLALIDLNRWAQLIQHGPDHLLQQATNEVNQGQDDSNMDMNLSENINTEHAEQEHGQDASLPGHWVFTRRPGEAWVVTRRPGAA